MEADLNGQLKTTAASIGYSDNQFIVESVRGIIEGARDVTNEVPRIVALIRSAAKHEIAPQHFGERPAPEPTKPRIRWWGC